MNILHLFECVIRFEAYLVDGTTMICRKCQTAYDYTVCWVKIGIVWVMRLVEPGAGKGSRSRT